MVQNEDRDMIARFITERFEERYLDAVAIDPDLKSGFTIMAICCLMVESLESFRRGLEDTKGKSNQVFDSFFDYWEEFGVFHQVSKEFYTHIRCGILHQAETTGGWRIIRTGPILDSTTINATKFSSSLRKVLRKYADSLRSENWESCQWRRFRRKMDATCRNTKNVA